MTGTQYVRKGSTHEGWQAPQGVSFEQPDDECIVMYQITLQYFAPHTHTL